MAENYDFTELITAIVDGESEDAISLVEDALKKNTNPIDIIDKGLIHGMNIVSEKYDKKLYFVPDLAASAEAMSDALELLNPLLSSSNRKSKGVVVIGVVKECSQEIGKNIVAAMLRGAGFTVHDMGINVSPEQFVTKCKETNADIIAMGSPMLQTIKYFRATIEELERNNLRDKTKVLVGGASTDKKTAEKVGADGWAENAEKAIKVAEELIAA